MHLRRVHIRNVRSIAELTWELPPKASGPGWHVILGDNGSGKSSLLRSIALAFVGPLESAGLRQPWDDWIRSGTREATIDLTISVPDRISTPDSQLTRESIPRSLKLRRDPALGAASWVETSPPAPVSLQDSLAWFSAAYGPFRRFTGGDKELERLFASKPTLARHLSVFDESVALTEPLSWLQSLKFKQLERSPEGALLAPIIEFINQPGFLPHGVRLVDVTSNGVEFVDAGGFKVPVQELSDGYRSILSMTFELVRQMALRHDAAELFSANRTQILRPGVVIIDEIDAHLHPSWQRTIGVWFRTHFPNVQFIVSTHSPLICQAAEVGSVFRLPRPGADLAADRGEMVTGLALKRLLYGNVLDAYGTGVFGEGVTRSDSGQQKLERLAELNTRELNSGLTTEEKRAQAELRDVLPTGAVATSSHDPAA